MYHMMPPRRAPAPSRPYAHGIHNALHPARSRLRLASPLTALQPLRRRRSHSSDALGVGRFLAPSPAALSPAASPRTDRSVACSPHRRVSPRRHACPLSCHAPRADGALAPDGAPGQTEQRPRTGRCSAPPPPPLPPLRPSLSVSHEGMWCVRAQRVHGGNPHPCPRSRARVRRA